jgi:hypothetical protein
MPLRHAAFETEKGGSALAGGLILIAPEAGYLQLPNLSVGWLPGAASGDLVKTGC